MEMKASCTDFFFFFIIMFHQLHHSEAKLITLQLKYQVYFVTDSIVLIRDF